MSILFRRLPLLIVVLFATNVTNAQRLVKEKMEVVYSLSAQDSIVRSQKTSTFDELGRLVTMQQYYYHHVDRGRLNKEEKSFFNAQESILTEHIITYPNENEPITQKMVSKYLDYQPKEADSKRIWRRLYDEYGEITREDTLTYNSSNQLIEQSDYDYRGNTSLFTHHYTYNKKGLQNKWITYSKWTTINGKGEVTEKKDKRRNYRYFYNKNDQLTKAKGTYYSSKFLQKKSYDDYGLLEKDYTFVKRKTKVLVPPKTTISKDSTSNQKINDPKTKKKPKVYKNKIDREEHIITYQNGRLVSDIKLSNKVELNKRVQTYQDTLLKTISISANNLTISTSEYSYNTNAILTEKTETKYSANGKPRYLIVTTYNELGLPIEEKQLLGEKVLSRLEITYDKERNPLVQSLSMNNGLSFEKTMYIYKYY